MIPHAVEVLSLTALPKEKIDSSGMVHNSDCREVSQDVTRHISIHEILAYPGNPSAISSLISSRVWGVR